MPVTDTIGTSSSSVIFMVVVAAAVTIVIAVVALLPNYNAYYFPFISFTISYL